MASTAPESTTIDVAEAHDEQSEIHQKLKRAKAAGAAVRARISVTMAFAGCALLAVLVVAVAGNGMPLRCIGVPGPVLLLLAVLPTDRLVIYGVAAVVCVASLVCAALNAVQAKDDEKDDPAADAEVEALLDELNTVDEELYAYAVELFEEQLAACAGCRCARSR